MRKTKFSQEWQSIMERCAAALVFSMSLEKTVAGGALSGLDKLAQKPHPLYFLNSELL